MSASGVITQDFGFEPESLAGLGFTGQAGLAGQSPEPLSVLASPVGFQVCAPVPCLPNTESGDHAQVS